MPELVLLVEAGGRAGERVCFQEGDVLTIGRAFDAAIRLPESEQKASRYHAVLEASASTLSVRDLDSKNGTFLNGARVQSGVLHDGDVLQIGKSVFRLSVSERPPETEQDMTPWAATEARENEVFFPSRAPAAAPVESQPPTHRLADPNRRLREPLGETDACVGCGTTERARGQSRWPMARWICERCADERRHASLSRRTLGGFDLLGFVAQGGSGAVYEARESRGGAHAAVKILRPVLAVTEKDVRRYFREQRLVSELDHPNIVQSFAVGVDPDQGDLFIATEFVGGGESGVLAHPRSDAASVLALGAELFDALAYAHERGVVHRDVKPGNVLLTHVLSDGRQHARLADFGLAKSSRSLGLTSITAEGETVGSACFIAPEQLLDFRNAPPSADLYSAGATLYFLLTGGSPLDMPEHAPGATVAVACAATLETARVPLRERRPGLSETLYEVMDALTARSARERQGMSARRLAEVFRGVS